MPPPFPTRRSPGLAALGAAGARPDVRRHAAMHMTPTLDAIVVVRGRVRLLLDADERVLGPGDVVIQRGVNHAWDCEGNEPALMAAILIRSEEHTSELQSLMRHSYAVFCLKK